jgi:hypothetical protein
VAASGCNPVAAFLVQYHPTSKEEDRGLRISTVIPYSVPPCNAGQTKSEVLIKNDGGGDIPQYIAKYLYLQLSGEWVVIDGDCLSACTLALGLLAQDRRCFTNKTRLGFHAAYTESGTPRISNPLGTDVLWSVYPPEIRRWISRHGGLTSKIIYLEGKELAAMYPPCRRPIRSLKKSRD